MLIGLTMKVDLESVLTCGICCFYLILLKNSCLISYFYIIFEVMLLCLYKYNNLTAQIAEWREHLPRELKTWV